MNQEVETMAKTKRNNNGFVLPGDQLKKREPVFAIYRDMGTARSLNRLATVLKDEHKDLAVTRAEPQAPARAISRTYHQPTSHERESAPDVQLIEIAGFLSGDQGAQASKMPDTDDPYLIANAHEILA